MGVWRSKAAFLDRVDAGRQLGERLAGMSIERPVVLGLARGGVVVAAEAARVLGAPLDVIVVRKLGAPSQPELAVGAVANAADPYVVRHEAAIEGIGLTEEAMQAITEREVAELRRREAAYGRAPIDLKGCTAIVVDDGIATGMTMRAALVSVRRRGASRVILGVPVAPADAIETLRDDVDEVVCLLTPARFQAVGQFYADFAQTTDDEVTGLLARGSGDSGTGGGL